MLDLEASMVVTALPAGVSRFAMNHFAKSPWRNGGGETQEIASGRFANPKHGVDVPWDWRLSLAEISTDGPFSTFFNVDRTAVLVEGGIALQAHACELRLSEIGQCETFPGEAALVAKIETGTPRLLNVMLQRERGEAQIEIHRLDAPLLRHPGSHVFLFVASGAFRVTLGSKQSARTVHCNLGADEGLHWAVDGNTCALKMLNDEGCLIQVNLCPVQPA